jgi:hypothetical protein
MLGILMLGILLFVETIPSFNEKELNKLGAGKRGDAK